MASGMEHAGGVVHARRVGWKRAFDLALGAVLMAASAPFVLLAMALVRLTSPGPALYTQARLGFRGRPYTIYKIRSMRRDCERGTGPQWAARRDPRVTPIGRLLRLSHLDELPQLFNVLRGEMSLVGPRPERPEIASELRKAVPLLDHRLRALPGLTGLAQVQLPPDDGLESVRRKLACDLYYIRRRSLGLDLRILVGTALGVLGVPFAVSRTLFRIPDVQAALREYESLLASAADEAEAAPAASPFSFLEVVSRASLEFDAAAGCGDPLLAPGR